MSGQDFTGLKQARTAFDQATGAYHQAFADVFPTLWTEAQQLFPNNSEFVGATLTRLYTDRLMDGTLTEEAAIKDMLDGIDPGFQ